MSKKTIAQIREITVILVASLDFIKQYDNYTEHEREQNTNAYF